MVISSWPKKTLLTPFHQNVYLASFQLVIAMIGIPLNVILASVVLSEPRNIFLLGVIFSSLSGFVLSFKDVTYVFFSSVQKDTEFCEAYMVLSGIPPTPMLSSTFISILDRQIGIREIWKIKIYDN